MNLPALLTADWADSGRLVFHSTDQAVDSDGVAHSALLIEDAGERARQTVVVELLDLLRKKMVGLGAGGNPPQHPHSLLSLSTNPLPFFTL